MACFSSETNIPHPLENYTFLWMSMQKVKRSQDPSSMRQTRKYDHNM
jgi:hypothetical protein